jgi:hypothetical protein
LNEKIEKVEAEEKKHLIFKRIGEKQKIVMEDVPLQYKYTSPYQIFPESFQFPGKHILFLERSFEMKIQDPSLTPKQIRS